MRIGPFNVSKKKIILLISFLLVTAVSAALSWKLFNRKVKVVTYSKIDLGLIKNDVKFPSSVWQYIETDLNSKKANPEASAAPTPVSKAALQIDPKHIAELAKRMPTIEPFRFKLFLTEKTEGILGKQNFEIHFPPGGGKLDLNQYVHKMVGSFYFKVVWDFKDLPLKNSKIYFVSRSQVREVGGKSFGSGCDHFFDLTTYWHGMMSNEGMFINTTDNRHVSLLAGTYFLNVYHNGKLYSAQLEVFDSENRNLLCAQ